MSLRLNSTNVIVDPEAWKVSNRLSTACWKKNCVVRAKKCGHLLSGGVLTPERRSRFPAHGCVEDVVVATLLAAYAQRSDVEGGHRGLRMNYRQQQQHINCSYHLLPFCAYDNLIEV